MGAALLGGPRLRDLAGAPFRSVDELLTLPSMTRTIYDRLRPFMTVYAQSAHVNPATAPREVLLAIPGISPALVALVLAARNRGQADLPSVAMPDLAGARQFLAVLDARTVTITAEVVAEPGTDFLREAVAAATSDPYHPFRVLEWRQDLRGTTASVASPSGISPR
jgi:general secretion pathway protein K